MALGVFSCPTNFSSESIPAAPLSTTRFTAAASRSNPTTRCPPRTRRSVMNAPIFPSPIIPSSIELPPLYFCRYAGVRIARKVCDRVRLLPCGYSHFRQLAAKLRHIPELYGVHSQFSRALQVQFAIVDQNALPGFTLRDFQRQAVDSAIRFANPQIARTEKHLEIIPQTECMYPVFVDLQRFI